MNNKKVSPGYRVLLWLVKTFHCKMKVEGTEHLPQQPAIIVGNHCQMHGPITAEIYFPGPHYTWCAGQMMEAKEVPSYAFQDFWSQKPRWTHWFYRILAYLITPLSVCMFNNAHTIAVYHDARVIGTFRATVRRLCEGNHVIIFPEHDVKHNHIVYDFQDKFIEVARLYHKKTGKCLQFVPMYTAPNLKKAFLDTPVTFDPAQPIEEERRRICDAMMEAITKMACALPQHTVVPYRNIPKKDYPSNLAFQEEDHAKTRR